MEPVMGFDTHLGTFDLVAVDGLDRELTSATLANTPRGWAEAIAVAAKFGITVVGVEGASSYGAALARSLVRAGITVKDVPTRDTAWTRRSQGGSKNDRIDARAAARAVLAGKGNRWNDAPEMETIRVVSHRRDSLVTEQTRGVNELRALLVDYDPVAAARLGRLRSLRAFSALAAVATDPDPHREVIAQLIRDLADDCARRLTQIRHLTTRLETLMPEAGQRLITQIDGCGVVTAAIIIAELAGTDLFATEAKFAMWAGAAPLDASSGQNLHHRLNRGGNRQVNRALHTIVITQLQHRGEAADYLTRRRLEGKPRRATLRACKRHLARRVWKILHNDLT
jgi:transposase